MHADFAGTAAVVRLLEHAGVDALPIKGCVFSALVRGDPGFRSSQDIDLLIRARDREGAAAALAGHGFQARPRSNGLIREVHLVHPRHACIDLHWSPAGASMSLPLDFETLWNERQMVRHGENSAPYPAHPWLVVLTALFALRKLPWVERRYIDDLAALVERFPALDWQRAHEVAEATRTVLMTTVALHLVERLGLAAMPSAASAGFPLDARAARLIEDIRPFFSDSRAEERREFVSEIGIILGNGRLREDWRDRLCPFAVLPLLLVLPDDKDAERAAASGRSLWVERMARVPEVVRALMQHREEQTRRRRFVATLDDGTAVISPAADTSLHLSGDDGLVLQQRTQSLIALNTAAAWLWCQIEDGLPLASVIDAYAETFAVDRDEARRITTAMLCDWWDRGLLYGSPSTTQPPEETPAPAIWTVPVPPPEVEQCFRILDQRIVVAMPDGEPAARIEGLLGHLADAGTPTQRLDVVADGEGFVIIRGGAVIERAPSLPALAPQVKSAALVTAINAQGFELYLHAAMLRRDGRALLLPAAPGSGKTCLSAALAERGYHYHTDEITLLSGDDLRARGVPTALTVKQPAWPVLEPLYPAVAVLAVHERIDGQTCRYLPPPVRFGNPDLDAAWPVGAVVFPRFDPTRPTALVRLGRIEALQRLLTECLAIRHGLTADLVERLAQWIDRVDAFSLVFRDFDEAAAALEQQVGRPTAEMLRTA